ncbi:MAG: hypothetical protein IPL43_13775 [Micropruina sp.]|nr:hypothetical protein [Micropruina sp.]
MLSALGVEYSVAAFQSWLARRAKAVSMSSGADHALPARKAFRHADSRTD